MKSFCENCSDERRIGCETIRTNIRNKTLEILEAESAMLELEIREFSALSIRKQCGTEQCG
jgi:hypothetical protein